MPRQPAPRRRRLARHALVVDREPAICQFVGAVFEDIGVSVTCAATAAEARRIARRRRFHLALIAVVLPDAAGDALAAEFVARAVPVILISGHPDGIRRGLASGLPFLRKPFPPKDLLRYARDHIANGTASREPAL
jgi:DNA-binding response OmpR family regulator